MFDSNFIANPYETYRCLRETAPLHWVDNFHRGAWLVPRYAVRRRSSVGCDRALSVSSMRCSMK